MVRLKFHRRKRVVRIHSFLFLLVLASCGTRQDAESPAEPGETTGSTPSQVIAPDAAPDDGIREVMLSASKVCPGDSLTVDIVPADEGHSFAIDGMETDSRVIQLTGAPGKRIIHVDAWRPSDRESLRTRQLEVEVRGDCTGSERIAAPTILAQPRWRRAHEVAFTVSNATALGASSYAWDFGDGSPVQVTNVPAVDHVYMPETLSFVRSTSVFDVTVRAYTPQGAHVGRKSIALHVPYARRKQEGVLQPPVVSEATWDGATRTLVATVYNPEPVALSLRSMELAYQPCSVGSDPSALTPMDTQQRLAPRSTTRLELSLPEAPDSACGVELRVRGSATLAGQPAQSYRVDLPLYAELRRRPGTVRPVEAGVAARLNALSARNLLPDGVVTDEDLSFLERSGATPALDDAQDAQEHAALQLLSATPPGPAVECAPGTAEAPPNPGWVCRATDQWIRNEPYLANAHTGDIVLSAACSEIGSMLRALDVPQRFSHAGIMIQHYDSIRHSTATTKRFEDHRAGPLGASGVEPDILRFAQPGVISASVDEAYHSLAWHDSLTSKDYRVGGFNEDGKFCPGDSQMVYPLVISGKAASYEKRKAIASHALGIESHYRFFAYSEGRISLDARYDMPQALGGPSAATMCSSFIWTAAREAGIPLEGALEARDVQLGAKSQAGILDGLYFYGAAERRAAAARLYSSIYNQVSEDAGLKGKIVDAPDNWANQIANCFASDYCSLAAKDSTAWKTFTSTGRTVSPQDMLFWDDPYGESEPLVYRVGTFRQVHVWQAPLGSGTLKVSVRDAAGTAVAGAGVSIDAFEILTNASGDVSLSPNAGRFNVVAQKRIGGVLYSGQASVVLSAGQSAAVTIVLKPPAASMRSVRITGTLKVVDDEVIGSHSASLSIREDVLLNPSSKAKTISLERCAGGETRAEVRIALVLSADNSVKATTTLQLFEGSSCNTDDREDTKSGVAELARGESTSQILNAKNTGFGGGDSARLQLAIINSQAP